MKQGTHYEECWRYHHECAVDLIETLRAERDALRKDAERWQCFIRTASLGFDGAPSWNAVIRLPVFDHEDQTITTLVDRIIGAERDEEE